MSARRRSQFLLPTPLGLVEYDVLEDTAFLGPSPRGGGVTADPAPFQEAIAAVTWTAEGFVIRPLPGEAAPRVNGEEANGAILANGDRFEIGQGVVTFRTESPPPPPATAPAPPPPADAARLRAPRVRGSTPRMRANPWVTAVALAGVLACLFGLYRAMTYLANLRAGERVRVYVPDPVEPHEPQAKRPDAAQTAYAETRAWEAANPEDLKGALSRYRDLQRRYPTRPEADQARARIRELIDEAGRSALTRLDAKLETLLSDNQYARALEVIWRFERKYGATPSGEAVALLERSVRKQARRALDALIEKVGPVVTTDPRLAHRMLLAAGRDFPPDLGGEVTHLMERAIELMKTRGPPPPEPRRTPPPPTPDRETPSPEDEAPAPGDPSIIQEAAAAEQWQNAYSDLTEGRYPQALEGYALLSLRYSRTAVFRDNRNAIAAGRLAAKVGAQGPTGLLSVPVEEKRGRLEIEYEFNELDELENDFTIEQPFPSERPVSVKPDMGTIRMSGASGLFHVLVWEPDVRFEARVRAEVARDFGMFAVAETDEYRAVMLNVNNTRFTLKKGAAARAQPGHLLWFMGKGVWADADADFIGYIKIAERPNSKIENGDTVTLELIRKGDACEGSFHGRTDGVTLQGKVRGDDGRTMGAARLGLFTNTGVMAVESVKISGKVDMAWFGQHLALLVDHARGPD